MTDDTDPAAAPAWAGPRTLGPEATTAAFPLGGIGTGNVSVGSRGELRDWEISNHPDKGHWLPFTFFAIRAQPEEGCETTRVLESRIPMPYEGDSGLHIGKVAGLPRLASSSARGRYPVLDIDFADDSLPVEVSLTAFTPLVPLDATASGMPTGVLRYTVTNPSDARIDVTVAGSMSTPNGIVGHDMFQYPRYAGNPFVEYREARDIRGLYFGTDLPPDDLRFGSASLTTTDSSVTATPRWATDFWQDGVQLFWDDFRSDGPLQAQPVSLEDGGEAERSPDRLPKLRTGTLGIVHALAPGETRAFEFVLSWHSPNRPRAWNGMAGLPNTNRDQVVRNQYAAVFADAWEVAERLHGRLPELERATRAFSDSLFESTLPPEVADAVSATLVALRSTTCFVLEDGSPTGQFAAWEGSFDHEGSCEGTCTHVWNYAQSVAYLFPELERSARRIEFTREMLDDGRMRFRGNSVFDNEPLEFHGAVDGQLGTIVRLYREWRFSGDDEFLAELWPAAQRALDYAFRVWDSDGDLVLDGQQHNTYDIEFYGANPLGNSMFLAALRASAAMARHLGDDDVAQRYDDAADLASRRTDELLFNGEYYEQHIEDVDAHRYQYGAGCLSDQLFGQTLAHLTGLGHLMVETHVRSAIKAIFDNNFRRSFGSYDSVQRTFALNDDQGLTLCTWPRGGRPRVPFVYSDEVWSGVEYQVATHLIYEGFVEEGLEMVRAIRNRYDGVRRNPWNEVECGNHYARSMASWGVLVALTGANWSASARSLHLAPAAHAADGTTLRFFFSTGTGWGRAEVADDSAEIALEGGRLEAEITIAHPCGAVFHSDGLITVDAGQRVTLEPGIGSR